MSTAEQAAEREMRRLNAKAEQMLREASAAVSAGVEITATKRLRALFDDAPWLAKSDAPVGGCGDLTYQDLFALRMMIDRIET